MIKETFEAAILTELAAKSQIDIYVQILESDGGLYSIVEYSIVSIV
jgi:ribonuclease PH